MKTGLIIIEEYCNSSQVEPSFIDLLENEGLIEIEIVEGEHYIRESQLQDLERFANWYYDLSINIEGIDVIQNLLQKVQSLEQELYSLRKLKSLHHKDLWEEIDE
ncbi:MULTISPECIES: chaperone modulator CbpM [unclassified Dysgonomonas]|uniref:chaperone modulator CbpM n=1 Tax=unclassified Dysgonomonas TaxID=2630389 RepID=UPI00068005E6|nr:MULTISPECIES: chaperone modulator CbpM [unclassified Dysgonomonas]MBD8349606.1 chaperone modulator CbpM [Dysgonomonas sp. HGC4]MBF0577794.1 chaperone modulator CbpM [Dysgonomonas sp. GY617]